MPVKQYIYPKKHSSPATSGTPLLGYEPCEHSFINSLTEYRQTETFLFVEKIFKVFRFSRSLIDYLLRSSVDELKL